MNIGLGTPNQAIISASENTVTLTAVPAQVLLTNTSSVTNGSYAHESVGQRTKTDTDTFSSSGNFTISKFDCQEACLSQCECFSSQGSGSSSAQECEGKHDIDACGCYPINANDALNFDSDQKFANKYQKGGNKKQAGYVSDPEKDVEEKINKQIKQTIADILSEIVQDVFQQSFSDCIQLE